MTRQDIEEAIASFRCHADIEDDQMPEMVFGRLVSYLEANIDDVCTALGATDAVEIDDGYPCLQCIARYNETWQHPDCKHCPKEG